MSQTCELDGEEEYFRLTKEATNGTISTSSSTTVIIIIVVVVVIIIIVIAFLAWYFLRQSRMRPLHTPSPIAKPNNYIKPINM